MSAHDSELAAFAAGAGVELAWPADLPASSAGDFRDDPRIDFGRVVTRTPRAVLRPATQDELAACMRFCGGAGLPYVTRGAAHSSGGQPLIDGGIVLDLRKLARIVADDPDGETITVEAGAWWLALVRHLAPQGRRPRSVTANLRSTIGGTLAVGGFGDSSHLDGLQISHVDRLTLITPDGQARRLGPDDELFRFALAGRGQLGVIAEATLRTSRRPYRMAARTMHWPSLGEFLRDCATISTYALYDFMRARLIFPPDGSPPWVAAHVGRSTAGPLAAEPWTALLRPSYVSPLELIDLYALLTDDRSAEWGLACPALEFVLPLPDGLTAWPELAKSIAAAGIPPLQPHGHSVMVVRADPRFPLAPTPTSGGSDMCLLVALRPELPAADAPALLPALRAIGRRAMELGARMYLMSIELDDPRFLERQLGSALPRLRTLKAELDPLGLLNPNLL